MQNISDKPHAMDSSFMKLAKKRRSSRKFTNQKPGKQQVEALLKAALMAPASKRSNPWHFIVVDDTKLLEKLSQSKQHGSKLIALAPLAIVVMADPNKSDVWVEDCSIASIYLQLAAEDLNLGSCWVQIRERMHNDVITSENYVKKTLDIPQSYRVESVIAIGYKTEEKPEFNDKDLLLERISHNSFSG